MSIATGKSLSIDDLIVEFSDTMERENRSFCPVVKKLTEMRETWTPDDFEQWIFAQGDYAVPFLIDVIRTAGTHHPPEGAAYFQTACAWQLTQYPWDKVRQPLELLLHGEVVQGIAPDAMKILIGIVRANHANAKKFLSHPFVLARIPPDVDMTRWPCRDFKALKTAPLKGARCADLEIAQDKVWTQLTGDGADASS